MDNKCEVVFVSTPNIGNQVPVVEFARHLIRHAPHFSATVFLVTVHQRPIVNLYTRSLPNTASPSGRIKFIHLQTVEHPTPDQYQSSMGYFSLFMDKHKPQVKHVISDLMSTTPAVALFVDMFTTSMIDVANQFGIPCYLFFASPASFLGFMFHLPELDKQLAVDFVESDSGLIVPNHSAVELIVPTFSKPLSPTLLPTSVMKRNRDGYFWYLEHARRYNETRGVVVNTFLELEPHAIDSLSFNGFPPIYPVGPILDYAGAAQWYPDGGKQDSIKKWLDDQPLSSVVFLCFGSMGSLQGSQLREIAFGLERSGYRFLWSICKPPEGKLDLPDEYTNIESVLPSGFLDRTAALGLVCGWVPQVKVLSHHAIGGFVSHCGWNSILESDRVLCQLQNLLRMHSSCIDSVESVSYIWLVDWLYKNIVRLCLDIIKILLCLCFYFLSKCFTSDFKIQLLIPLDRLALFCYNTQVVDPNMVSVAVNDPGLA